MGLLGRATFREALAASTLGTLLFTFVLFLRGAGKLFELLVRSSADLATVAYLFGLALPPALVFTAPIGVLVGLLVALGRMSADGEVTAMRAAGVPARRVILPVGLLALLGVVATAAFTLWLTPWSYRETQRIAQRLAAEQLTADIQPRVFQEQFPNAILFVQDVKPGTVARWERVFLADLRPPDQRGGNVRETAESPRITVAREAIAIPDTANNRIQLSLVDGSSHEPGRERTEYFSSYFPQMQQALEAEPPRVSPNRPIPEMDTGPLVRLYRESADARIELHQRLALPLACLLLALVGVPLGVSSRKSGKSAAVVTTVFLAFLYHTALISLIGLARQGTLPAALAVWTPNLVLAALGLFLLSRLERPGERDLPGAAGQKLSSIFQRLKGFRTSKPGPVEIFKTRIGHFPILPQVLDTYVLTSLLLYFGVFLTSFVLLTEVYTFFELLSDIVQNRIPMSKVFAYLFYLSPMLIYNSASVSTMVAVLVTFGVMAKHNELVGFKSCGIGLHRLVVPVAVTSLLLSVGLFFFDYYYVPEANRRQDALRAEIKGRAIQTYRTPGRPWIYGQGPRIYYYKFFDPSKGEMGGVSVYELDPDSFRLRRHISASRAIWSPPLNTWVFTDGWRRDLEGVREKRFEPFETATFAELTEPPGYFVKEVKQDKQMNFHELRDYIADLRQSGFDTVKLRIQYYKKFSTPLFVLILALLSAPFAFLTGNRGALAGVGVSLGIAIAYWSLNQLFEQVGNLNQLPPLAAAWAPDAVFLLTAFYLMARMKT